MIRALTLPQSKLHQNLTTSFSALFRLLDL